LGNYSLRLPMCGFKHPIAKRRLIEHQKGMERKAKAAELG